MKATRSEALLNCADWNRETAKKLRKAKDDNAADRMERQADALVEQAFACE